LVLDWNANGFDIIIKCLGDNFNRMDRLDDELFQFAFQLHDSRIKSLDHNDKSLIICFDLLHIHKYLGKIGFGIEESFTSQAEMILKDAVIHGNEPEYPGRIIDFSLVEDGKIHGNHINYPFTAKGDIQLVITFSSHEKITIRSSKAFMMIKDLDNQKSHVQ